MEKCVIYARFSSANQREESIDAQIRAATKYCEDHGLTVIHVYADRAKSGRTDKRPEFLEMLEAAKSGEFNYLVVHKLDRFSRNKYDSVFYKAQLKKNGVRVLSVTENLDDSPESIILESMLEGMGAYYSANLRRETMKGMMENAHNCKHNGGKPPLGFDVDPDTKTYFVNPIEAEVVREIFEKYLSGWGYKKLIQYLNGKGIKTKWGRMFGNSALYGILRNSKYVGKYSFNVVQGRDATGKRRDHKRKSQEEIITKENGIPAIVDPKVFHAVQEKLRENKRLAGQEKAKRTYLLSGLIFCGECGSPYHGNSRLCGRGVKKYTTYRCSLKSKEKGSCPNKEVSADYLEQFVLEELQRLMLKPARAKRLVQKIARHSKDLDTKGEERTREIQVAMNQVKEKIERLVTAIKNGIDVPSVKEELETLEATKADLEARLHSIKHSQETLDVGQVKKALVQFQESVKAGDTSGCKSLLRVFLERVDVFLDRVNILMKVDMSSRMRKQAKVQLKKVSDTEAMTRYRHAA